MEIMYYGHSAFGIKTDGHLVLIDPFFTGNPHTDVDPLSIRPIAIIVTHGHGDHIGDTVKIAKESNAIVISSYEICNWVAREGHQNIHPLHIGGGSRFEFGYVKLTIAHHGSSSAEGVVVGTPSGVLLCGNEGTIYHAGDTGLFLDMQLVGEINPIDIAMLPIGGNFTMDITDALKAVDLLKPRVVIPMHYNTFPMIKADPMEFVSKLPKNIQGLVMQPGVPRKVSINGRRRERIFDLV